MNRNWIPEIKLLTAKATIGTSLIYPVKDWQHLMLTLSSQSNANFTIKFQGSFSDDSPVFSSAQSATNRWDYIEVKDYQNNSSISGDVGISFSGVDDVRMLEFNTNGIKWVAATITAISAGSVNLYLTGFNNQ